MDNKMKTKSNEVKWKRNQLKLNEKSIWNADLRIDIVIILCYSSKKR